MNTKTKSTKLNLSAKQLLLEEAKKVRPNCAIPDSFFQDNMIVCTGEDPAELRQAMRAVLPGKLARFHEFRCYKAWKFTNPNVTVVISGIGSGCLEPLLFELLDEKTLGQRAPKRLVMIGTAGYIADKGHGQVFVVDEAYPMGCAVHLESKDLPLRPQFRGLEAVKLSRAAEMSTDYYYAATPATDDRRKMAAKTADPALLEGIDSFWKAGRLISMESAQFYHFCRCYGSTNTQYVALRGVANLADQFHEQGDYSKYVLNVALSEAVKLLSA
jgi:Phosphorylase superfamily